MKYYIALLTSCLIGLYVLAQPQSQLIDSQSTPTLSHQLIAYNIEANDTTPKPLIIFLHGIGERGSDNTTQLTHWNDFALKSKIFDTFSFYLLAPQCPINDRWTYTDYRNSTHKFSDTPTVAIEKLMGLIDSISTHLPINTQQIYGMGISLGGFGIFDVSIRKPNLFNTIYSICGGADTSQLKKISSSTRILLCHGKEDRVVPFQNALNIQYSRIYNFKIFRLENIGHDAWRYAFKDEYLNIVFGEPIKIHPLFND